jgi:hypothetical protein
MLTGHVELKLDKLELRPSDLSGPVEGCDPVAFCDGEIAVDLIQIRARTARDEVVVLCRSRPCRFPHWRPTGVKLAWDSRLGVLQLGPLDDLNQTFRHHDPQGS